jgi:hypothetical protein
MCEIIISRDVRDQRQRSKRTIERLGCGLGKRTRFFVANAGDINDVGCRVPLTCRRFGEAS